MAVFMQTRVKCAFPTPSRSAANLPQYWHSCWLHCGNSVRLTDFSTLSITLYCVVHSFALCIMEDFNTEMFIDEVKKREAIWNSSSETYKDRILKKNQWSELCSLFCPSFDDQTPKEKAATCKSF
jgi:hypothetical protein